MSTIKQDLDAYDQLQHKYAGAAEVLSAICGNALGPQDEQLFAQADKRFQTVNEALHRVRNKIIKRVEELEVL